MTSKRYHQLDSIELTETIATLKDRIKNRFPESGLYQVSGELLQIAKTASKDAEWIDRPNLLLRLAIVLQKFKDNVALQAVNDIETLTTGLSQKICQKVSILRYDLSSGRAESIDADEKSVD